MHVEQGRKKCEDKMPEEKKYSFHWKNWKKANVVV